MTTVEIAVTSPTFLRLDGERAPFPTTLEFPRPEKLFDEKTAAALRERGEVIVDLYGRSIDDVFVSLLQLGSLSTRGNETFQTSRSRSSQIAFNPNRLVIPHSNNRTYNEQSALIEEEATALVTDIPGATKVMPSAADIYDMIGIVHRHGFLLFGEDFGYPLTRTSDGYAVGAVTTGNGIRLYDVDEGRSANWLYAAPLIVPATDGKET